MAINKKLIHFQTYQAFQTELEAGNILDTSIVWIKETHQIYTHGEFYDCSEQNASTLLMTGYAVASGTSEEELTIQPTDTLAVAMGKIQKQSLDNEEVVAQAFVNFKNVLGVENPNQEMPDLSDTNYLSGQTQFVSALKALDTAIAENGGSGETEVLVLDSVTDLNNGTGNITAEVYQKISDAITNKKPIFICSDSTIAGVNAVNSSYDISIYLTNVIARKGPIIKIQATVLIINGTDYSITPLSNSVEIYRSGDGTQFLSDDGTYKSISNTLSNDYAASTEVNAGLEPKGGDTYEEAIGKLHKAILDDEGVIAKAFTNLQSVLGVENPGQVMPDLSDTNYLSGQTQFVAALKALDSALKTVADQAATISALTDRVAALETALTIKEVGA